MLWSLADNDNHDTNILTSFAFNEKKMIEKKHEHWTNQTECESLFKTVAWMKTAVVKLHIATEMEILVAAGIGLYFELFSCAACFFCVFVHSGLSITSKWLTMPTSISVTFSNAKLHANKMDVIWTFVNRKKYAIFPIPTITRSTINFNGCDMQKPQEKQNANKNTNLPPKRIINQSLKLMRKK